MAKPKKPKQVPSAIVPVEHEARVEAQLNVRNLSVKCRGISVVYEGSAEGAVDVLKALNEYLGGGR